METPGIRFIVTSLCNCDCTYCHNEWEPKTGPVSALEQEKIAELIAGAKKLGATEVAITGGEPLLKIDRVKTILKIGQDLEMWSSITTNGFLINKYADSLRERGLKETHVHVPSLDPETYKHLMGKNADLGRVLDNLDTYRESLGIIKINVPILDGTNNREIPDFLNYFNPRRITPRFIESMSTNSFRAGAQQTFDDLIKKDLGDVVLTGSYLWGINKYDSSKGPFEILRCICFDRKCDVCPETNFIHVDQDYNVRPCNLRPYRIPTFEGKAEENLREGLEFLSQQTDIPEEYKSVWGHDYVPLRGLRGET